MKTLLLCGALCAISALPALAQGRANQQNQNNNGAVFPLPPNVKNVVSIDAHNILIVESENNGLTQYTPIIIKHVYSGGIARLFGGTVVPTEQFVSPGLMNNGNGQNTNGTGGTGVTGFGGGNNNGFGGGNNNNFGGGGFGGGFVNNAITRGTFNGSGAFGNGLFNGTIATNGSGITNLQISPR